MREVESPPSPIWRQVSDVGHPEKVGCRRTEFRMRGIRRRWNVDGQNSGCKASERGGMSGVQDSGCEASKEGGMSADRIPDVRHPEKVGRTCMRIEIEVMQSEGMCMGINTVGRPPADASTSSRQICLVVCNLGYLLTAKA